MTTFNLIKKKIDTIFSEINSTTNYFAIANHTCCQSCGHYEIDDALETANLADKKAYVFYHWQDRDSIKKQCTETKTVKIYLAYGCFKEASNELEICESMFDEIKKIVAYHGVEIVWAKIMAKGMILSINL